MVVAVLPRPRYITSEMFSSPHKAQMYMIYGTDKDRMAFEDIYRATIPKAWFDIHILHATDPEVLDLGLSADQIPVVHFINKDEVKTHIMTSITKDHLKMFLEEANASATMMF
jgi:hypothetical protein